MSKSKIFALMSMFAALGSTGNRWNDSIETKSVEDIMEERRNKGLKPSYVEKPVKSYMGKKKVSRSKRKNNKL